MKNTASINSTKFFLKNTDPFYSFIWLGKNFIEIAVTDTECKKVEVIKSFEKATGNVTGGEALEIFKLQEVKDASRVFVGLESDKFTLVPNTFFDPQSLAEYLKPLFDIETTETIATQKLVPIDCHSVFSLKKGTHKLLDDALDDLSILHAPSALLIAYQQLLPPNKEFYSFLRVNENAVVVSIFKNKQLQLHQSYEIESTADALYYYLNALQTLGFNKTKTTATLLGKNKDLEQLKVELSGNIESVKYGNRLPTLQYTEEIFSQPAHKFFNLFALILCA